MKNIRLSATSRFLDRILEDEVVFVSKATTDDGLFILKGRSGVDVWKAVKAGRDFRQIVEEAGPEAAKPLLEILGRMRDAGILAMEEAATFEPPASGSPPAGFAPPEFLTLRVRDLLPTDLVIQGASVTGASGDIEVGGGGGCAQVALACCS